jgi:phosphoribosylcarboxyaminoimidazole (NCAIR) mutase
VNAALFAASLLAADDVGVGRALDDFRARQTQRVLDRPDPSVAS